MNTDAIFWCHWTGMSALPWSPLTILKQAVPEAGAPVHCPAPRPVLAVDFSGTGEDYGVNGRSRSRYQRLGTAGAHRRQSSDLLDAAGLLCRGTVLQAVSANDQRGSACLLAPPARRLTAGGVNQAQPIYHA